MTELGPKLRDEIKAQLLIYFKPGPQDNFIIFSPEFQRHLKTKVDLPADCGLPQFVNLCVWYNIEEAKTRSTERQVANSLNMLFKQYKAFLKEAGDFASVTALWEGLRDYPLRDFLKPVWLLLCRAVCSPATSVDCEGTFSYTLRMHSRPCYLF